MATFPKLREYIDNEIGQNLNYLHIRKTFHAMLDLLSVATNTYSGGDNIDITNGVISLIADDKTQGNLQRGYEKGLMSVNSNS